MFGFRAVAEAVDLDVGEASPAVWRGAASRMSDLDEFDRYLSEIDDALKEQGVDPDVRADFIDRIRAAFLAPEDDPSAGVELLALFAELGKIGEAYERRMGNNDNADFIARYMTGFVLWLQLPEDLRDLAGGPLPEDPLPTF